MNKLLLIFTLFLSSNLILASEITKTIKVFMTAGESAEFFKRSFGYAVFPTIGKAGFVIGGAYGDGQVFKQGIKVGKTSMSQVSVGFQIGAQGFSQIIFFEDKRAFSEFTNGNFEFAATAQAVAITAGASASATTTGNSTTASGGQNNATTTGKHYNKGMAVFTIAKGGLMFEVSLAGQKFKYTAD